MDFKVALRMAAGRAYIRSFCTYYDMTAIAAFPNFDFALLKHLSSLNIIEQSAIAFFELLFD